MGCVKRAAARLRVAFLLLLIAWVEAAPPRVLSAEYEVRHVGTISVDETGEPYNAQYTGAIITVSFDQPLFVNGSLAFASLSPDAPTTQHVLLGLARLQCGHRIVESHPTVPGVAGPHALRAFVQSAGAQALAADIPLYLVPLNEPLDHVVHRLFTVFKRAPGAATGSSLSTLGANRFVGLLVLDYDHGDGRVVQVAEPGMLRACVLSFPPPSEQTWWPVGRLTNAGGEAFFGACNLTEAGLAAGAATPEPPRQHAERLAQLARAAALDRPRMVPRQQRDSGEQRAAASSAQQAHDAQQAHHDSVAVLLERARGTHFIDDNNAVDTTHVYSLLQTMHRVGTLEQIEANQYFELIEDPLLNLLVPMMVDIVASMQRKPIAEALCKLLEKLLPPLLSMPIVAAMTALELEESASPAQAVQLSPDLVAHVGRKLLSAVQRKILEPAGLHAAPASAVTPPPPPQQQQQPPPPPPPQQQPLPLALLATDERAAGSARNGPAHHSSGTGCSSLITQHECFAGSGTEGRSECLWCEEGNPDYAAKTADLAQDSTVVAGEAAREESGEEPPPDGLVAKCVAVENKIAAEQLGLKCEEKPEPVVVTPPEPVPLPELEPMEVPKPTKLEEDLSSRITDAAASQLAHNLRLSLASNLRKDVNSTVVRGVSRALTQSLTVSLTQGLTQSLLNALAGTITRVASKELTATLTPALTHSLVPTITHALTRRPSSDTFCYFCSTKKVYCEQCVASAVEDYMKDYYADYYAEYYSRYYSFYYGSVYSELFASSVMG